MIDVPLTKRAEKDRVDILFYLREKLPAGNDEEAKAAVRIIQAEQAKIQRGLDQLRRLPESGPVNAGAIRKITLPGSR